MIDLHSHLLPGIDDGAANLEDALKLVDIAVEDGISHSVITPHIHLNRYDNDVYSIQDAFDVLHRALRVRNIPLRIAFAAEVRIDPQILAMIASDKIPFLGELGGYKILLLEFPHSIILPGTEKFIEHLLSQNIRPLVAHPERNKAVLTHLEKIQPIREAGAMLQVTARSITGGFGPYAKKRSLEMLERGWVDVVATDAHNVVHRPPRLQAAFNVVCQHSGEEVAARLFQETPAAISAVHFSP
ncbi:MAG TPA: capsular biosynthesis protein [Gammaproteobacteria bacterium]|nr:capsular biosynthesis protein [Gammaproteobacteria bacterium]